SCNEMPPLKTNYLSCGLSTNGSYVRKPTGDPKHLTLSAERFRDVIHCHFRTYITIQVSLGLTARFNSCQRRSCCRLSGSPRRTADSIASAATRNGSSVLN